MKTKTVLIIFFFIFSFTQKASAEPFSENCEFQGKHFIASFIGCNHLALLNIDNLKQAMIKATKASGARIISAADYVFSAEGYTLIVLLSESHASVHSYPENNTCFIDLFTCGEKCEAKVFKKVMEEYLSPDEINFEIVQRG